MITEENIFFDVNRLKRRGKNVIIGKTARIRYPELVEIGDNVIIDDFTYISTQLKIHSYVHIASGCKLIGGNKSYIELCDYVTLAPNCLLAAGSDDYVLGLTHPMIPTKYRGNIVIGKIILNKFVIIGANSVVMPNVIFSEGSAIGALSLIKKDCACWSVYAGVPAKKIKLRNKTGILKLYKQFQLSINS